MPVKNSIPGQSVTEQELQRVKKLRRDMTPAEKTAKRVGRNPREQIGCPFQDATGFAGFIVDFYCHKAALVIAVDGNIHDTQKKEDAKREKVLSTLGLKVIRFRNDEIFKNVSVTMEKIKAHLN